MEQITINTAKFNEALSFAAEQMKDKPLSFKIFNQLVNQAVIQEDASVTNDTEVTS